MPELPEVETIARGVDARVRGDRIVDVWFGPTANPSKRRPARQAKALEGRSILSVHRTGKHIVVELQTAISIWPQGHSLKPGKPRRRPVDRASRHDRAAARDYARSSRGAAYPRAPDARKRQRNCASSILGALADLSFATSARGNGFAGPGAEPLTIGAAEFAALFRGRKLAIKAALLNQTLLAGVGNIYADESLFRAGIRPRRRAGQLTRAELERLRVALREVLEHAIRLGGSSVSDYVDAEGVRGFFQLEHCVYQRTGEPCRNCGSPIRRIVVAGRSTHYCAQLSAVASWQSTVF